MRFGIVIFCAVILLLLAGVLPVGNGMSARAVYYSPLMILLLALLSGLCVRCCFKRRPLGFILVHFGVVIILAGAFVGYVAGTKGSLQLSLQSPRPQGRLVTQDGATVDFGFDVAAEDFEVWFYPPVYTLYRPLPPEEILPGQMPFEKIGELNPKGRERLQVGDVQLPVSTLRKNGEWVERYRFADGSFLFRGSPTPSYYGVTLLIDGEKIPVSINHPADHHGWRFYLVSYDQRARRYVQLSARRDPGRGSVIAGIWIVMIGTFVLCFRKTGGAA
ncbi:cytochrome c biogenesis protein ResB [Tichowtungia aerotolerans]|uniref:Uncharacterized protein n=1 Tax=Tichowtungia aerotolerans TaxID=2697043 RepID=A0A6P1M9P5_9BACT|nr:cytochrome c biogenesis protein ResB [Tichowtungia aerotolerans]QHI70647.1 hypothetical protein GT409_14755 [Tichowtungia aerotolerans]